LRLEQLVGRERAGSKDESGKTKALSLILYNSAFILPSSAAVNANVRAHRCVRTGERSDPIKAQLV
jgi:hypothetical protein